MKVLWIFAHPEERSMNSALRDEGMKTLAGLGHETRESDLYAMGWNPLVTRDDVRLDGERLVVGAQQECAYRSGRLSEDIRTEQEKIAWADVLVLHFPMWWFGPPAILKGWFDRVLVQGFAFGLKGPDGRTLRYGEGGLADKRGMVITSVGARESSFGPRGIHGYVDEVLFPVLRGTFHYTGMAALPPLVLYGADRLDAAGYDEYVEQLRSRLEELPSAKPVPFRTENGGDYDQDLVLREHLAPGQTGLGVHYSR